MGDDMTHGHAEFETVDEHLGFDEDRDLPGAVFMVPNRRWGFEVVSAEDHPGACLHYSHARRSGQMLQGTDASMIRSEILYHIIEPNSENGLKKPTAFKLAPRYIRRHNLITFIPQRIMGRLSESQLLALRNELARLNPEE